MQKARYYEKVENSNILCMLCSHNCHIPPGKRGICKVRENRYGELFSLVYGKVVSGNVDPVEKKPLFHFLPGSMTFSISTVGCNFRCRHCQNFQISQYPAMNDGKIPGVYEQPENIVRYALHAGCGSISYTYVEPAVFYEYAFDVASLATEKELKNIFVSNGYMQAGVIHELSGVLDAINIDLKFFRDSSYKTICKSRLQPVLDNIRLFHELGVWVEVTTLIIPGLNDSKGELRDIARFIKGINKTIPWHVTAFHPAYNMTDRPPTDTATLKMAGDIGHEEGLLFVYEGNRPGSGRENTFCPDCGMELISRHGFTITDYRMRQGKCPECGCKIAGIWEK